MYGEGVSRVGEIIDFAVEADILEKSGAWFSYNGERLGQGRDKVKKLLQENEALCEEIAQKVREHSEELLGRSRPMNSDGPSVSEEPEAPPPSRAAAAVPESINLDIEADESDFD